MEDIMLIQNLTVAGLKQVTPMKMVIVTRGRKPGKNVTTQIEIDQPHLVVRGNHNYLHCHQDGKKKSFGPGTDVIFK